MTCATPSRRRGVLGALLALLTVAACGGGAGPTALPPRGTLTLGGATEDTGAFVELADGADVTLSPGAQGGFHVFLNVRISANVVGPDGALDLEREARRADTGALVSQAVQRVDLVPSLPGFFDSAAPLRLFLCPTPVGISIRDQALVLRVDALETATSTAPRAEATRRFTPRCPATAEEAATCARICSG